MKFIILFLITEENNKFELYTFSVSKIGGVTYEKVKNEIEKDLDISDFTATDLQDELIGPINIEEFREQESERMKNDQYMKISAIYTSTIFQYFESFLRTEVALVGDDFRLVLDECN